MSTETTNHRGAQAEEFDASDPRLTRFDLVREGARRDGVEIVHYEPRFPVPGTPREKRIVRTIGFIFFLAGVCGTVFVVAYIWWPWRYHDGVNNGKLYTPILGISLGLALALVGIGLVSWGKKLLPEEISVQERHPGGSEATEKKLTGATMLNMVDEIGVKRRPLLALVALAGLAPLGVIAAEPLIGGLLKNPHKFGPDKQNILFTTGWDPNGPDNPNK